MCMQTKPVEPCPLQAELQSLPAAVTLRCNMITNLKVVMTILTTLQGKFAYRWMLKQLWAP